MIQKQTAFPKLRNITTIGYQLQSKDGMVMLEKLTGISSNISTQDKFFSLNLKYQKTTMSFYLIVYFQRIT